MHLYAKWNVFFITTSFYCIVYTFLLIEGLFCQQVLRYSGSAETLVQLQLRTYPHVIVSSLDAAKICVYNEIILQEMLNIVGENGRDFKVKFSSDKSQVMVVEGRRRLKINRWKLGDLEIKRMNEYNTLLSQLQRMDLVREGVTEEQKLSNGGGG